MPSQETVRNHRIALEQFYLRRANDQATCCARPDMELMVVREDGRRVFECRGCGVRAGQ